MILLAALFLPMSAAAVEDPGLTCRNAILIDATYDEVLYDKGAYDKVYPASITKVMTALLVLEAVDAGQLTLDTPITATAEALEVPEGSSTAKIQVGDTYTLEQYLYCLLLPSGNEVAQILAIAVDGSVEAFVDHMNQRAEELGCEGTHFANPHGYHDENHYTTAYDITRFMKAAMEYDLFQTILTSPNYTLPANGVSEERIIRNTNALTSNWTYTQYLYGPGTGGKTGTTDEAGNCLVETARKGDMYLISVILGAEEVKQADGNTDARQFSETIKLLNWGFDNFQRVTLSPDETLVTKVKVNLSTQADEVNVKPLGSITRTLPKDIDLEQVEMVPSLFSESVDAPVEAGQVLGILTIRYDGTEYGRLDLVADTSVERSDFLYYKHQVETFFQNAGVRLLLVVVLVLVVIVLLRVLGVPEAPALPLRRRHGARAGGATTADAAEDKRTTQPPARCRWLCFTAEPFSGPGRFDPGRRWACFPHRMPSIRRTASSTDIPRSRLEMPCRLPMTAADDLDGLDDAVLHLNGKGPGADAPGRVLNGHSDDGPPCFYRV